MYSNKKLSIEQLRQKIDAITSTNGVQRRKLNIGIAGLDSAVGGWPYLSEVSGRVGAGRLSILQPCASALTQRGALVAIVDPLCLFNPVGWSNVDLENLTLARPPLTQCQWTAEQLAGSGCFELVVVIDPPNIGKTGARILRAAESGLCSVVIVTTEGNSRLPAHVRLIVEGWRKGGVMVSVEKGGRGERVLVAIQSDSSTK
jgi:hypothetical protein